MKKQWKQLVFVLLTMFLLTACGIQSVEQYEKMEDDERSVEEVSEPPAIKEQPAVEKQAEPVEKVVPKEEPPIQAEEKIEVKEEPKLQPIPQPKEEIKEAPKAEPKPVPTPEPPVEVKREPIEQVEIKQEPVAKPAPQQAPAPKPAEKKRTVTIAIYVQSLVANLDKLHPSLQSEKYVPANGIVLTPVTYELLSEKDTVWDVLRRAAKEHNIQLEYEGADENIYDSVYIEGIHHLYEFSAGPLSGWMYKVNGVFPNYGASQYSLEDGDVIEWHYTVDLGRDLGKGA